MTTPDRHERLPGAAPRLVDLHELRTALASRGVDERVYVLDGLTLQEPVEGAVYVSRIAHRYEVGVQKRGEPLADFPDEQSACAFAVRPTSA